AARPAPPPRLTWLADDGAPLTDLPGVRRIHPNGTLELLPAGAFAASGPRLVRCRADNAHGTIVSRDVHIVPVADGNWEVAVEAPAAGAGGVAALTCRVSGAPARAALWYRADTVLSVDAPAPESRYLSAGDTLLIRGVSAADAGAYSCLARHDLTALTKRSRPALLNVLPSSAGSAPRVVSPARELAPPAGALLCLPCASTDYPPPHYTWYRESQGRLQPVEASSSVWLWSGGAALCVRAARDTDGAWLCKAYNVFGDATAQIRLDVQLDITVTIQPEFTVSTQGVQVAEAGSTVRLNCSSNEPGASLQWVHNGAVLAGAAGGALVLRGAARSHAGVYQCVARAGLRSAQASAEVRLGNSPPELQYTFIEQALRAGGAVALRCAAAATPPPAFAWLLDSQPLDRYIPRHRYHKHHHRSNNIPPYIASILPSSSHMGSA
ncbi:Down syndrome cell adhesion molecule-like protein Dscam2, partial [Zerene cesonia]|uniref:Down syndrome cell adhesion molecule-like protein Dscam2 n=1 Tax=Zerene cesonia TaxID=33412 RepID=UPI0018E57E2E